MEQKLWILVLEFGPTIVDQAWHIRDGAGADVIGEATYKSADEAMVKAMVEANRERFEVTNIFKVSDVAKVWLVLTKRSHVCPTHGA